VIRIQGRAVVYGELWFDEAPPQHAGVDILICRYRPAPLAGARTTELHSLQTDLAPPAEAIAASFEESCRRQIRRAEREDRLRHELFARAADALDEFAAFYDAFARQKGLWLADRHWLARAAAARQLALSCVSRHARLQGRGNRALRLGRHVRRRIDARARRHQPLQEDLRRLTAAGL
jgi:hypothetical protein